MKSLNFKKFLLIISILCANTFACKSEVIIFDLYGVLFEIPWYKQVKQMGIRLPFEYRYLDGKSFSGFREVFFKVLEGVKVDATYDSKENTAKASNQPMAPIMYMWQANKMGYLQVLKNTLNHVEELDSQGFFWSNAEKQMMIIAANVAFDLETRKKMYQPIAKGVEILKSCAAKLNPDGTKKNKLYVLSNMDNEMTEHLKKTYPEIFNLFDGIVVSGETGTLKPDRRIYQELIKKYNINPSEAIFIDDQQENIKGYLAGDPIRTDLGSESVGIAGILCKDFSALRSELEKRGIIDPQSTAYRVRSEIEAHPILSSAIIIGIASLIYYFNRHLIFKTA